MRREAILLACVVYAGHGRRKFVLEDTAQRISDAERLTHTREDNARRVSDAERLTHTRDIDAVRTKQNGRGVDGVGQKSQQGHLAEFLFAHSPAISSRFVSPAVSTSFHKVLPQRRRQSGSSIPVMDAAFAAPRNKGGLRLQNIASQIVTQRRRVKKRFGLFFQTFRRVAVPTVIAAVGGFLYFEAILTFIRSKIDVSTLMLLQADESQFIQSFLTVIGLLFSILASQAYGALYSQQESRYNALYLEVSEAKSLLEQTTLVCQGRPFYQSALACMRDYVKNDLVRLDVPPSTLLSTRPMEDPLESIMYMTSVGVPSIVYETVKNLRQARGVRLGAMQRKFPFLGILLLYFLAFLNLVAFPLLGAVSPMAERVIVLQSLLFGLLTGAHMLVLRIIQELWRGAGGVFNVDAVLQEMVAGLEDELELRSQQATAVIPSAQGTTVIRKKLNLDQNPIQIEGEPGKGSKQ